MNSDDIHRRWATRSAAYSPEYYAYYGPDGTSDLLLEILESAVGTDAAVLEPGCSAGRHLAHLYEHGFDDLSGIDVNEASLEVLAENYPDLATAGSFYLDPIETVVPAFDDGAFDAVYTVETLQHLPPASEEAFADLARVADDLLVTVENEGGELATVENEGGEDDRGSRERIDGSNGRLPDDSAEGAARESTRVDSIERVSYVDGELPLYHRRWDRVFEDLGFVERESRSLKRDTVRVFRRS